MSTVGPGRAVLVGKSKSIMRKETTIVELPNEIQDKIFSYLDVYTLHKVNQVCLGWTGASTSARYFKWIGELSVDMMTDLPQRYPLLQHLRVLREGDVKNPFPRWKEDHSSLRHMITDNFWIANHVMQCPNLEFFEYCRFDKTQAHAAYFCSQFDTVVSHLIPRISVLAIQNIGSRSPYQIDFSSKSSLNSRLVAQRLTSLTLHLSNQSLHSIYEYISQFEFPHVKTLSLGEFTQSPNGIQWPEFVSKLQQLFPRLENLHLEHLFSDISDYLPKNLLAFEWNVWVTSGSVHSSVSLSRILDQQTTLSRLMLTLLDPIICDDDLQKSSYPSISHLELEIFPDTFRRFHRFPNLRVLNLGDLNSDVLDDLFSELYHHCPGIEQLSLTVTDEFYLSGIDEGKKGTMHFPNLKSFTLYTRDCDYKSLADMMSRHQTLETIDLNAGSMSLDHPSHLEQRYLSCKELHQFTLVVPAKKEIASALIHLGCQSRHLRWFSFQDGTFYEQCSNAVDFPSFWPNLKYLEYERLVTCDELNAWSTNPDWSRQLVSISFGILNTKETWFSLLSMLESHRSIESCIIWLLYSPFPYASNDSKSETTLTSWSPPDPKQRNEFAAWKSKVKSVSQDTLANVIFEILNVENTDALDESDTTLSNVIRSLLTHRVEPRIGFDIFTRPVNHLENYLF